MSGFKDAFAYPSMVARVATGKTIGFFYGLLIAYLVHGMLPDASLALLVGLVLWYTIIGALVGLCGVFRFYVFFTLKWWFRGPWVAMWMTLTLALLSIDFMPEILAELELTTNLYIVQAIIEGIVLGLVMDFLATKFGGEGKETVKN